MGESRRPGGTGREEFDEGLRGLRDALEGLRGEIRSQLTPTPSSDSSSGLDPLALFDELRRRMGTLWVRERSARIDEFGMEEAFLEAARPLLDFLMDRYWRMEVEGLESLPSDGPCLLVANRSGLLPYDGLMTSHAIARRFAGGRRPRFLVADWLIELPFMQSNLARLGGVRACRENADRLLRSGRSVIAFPEESAVDTKLFRERYRVGRFAEIGPLEVALERRVPIIPVGIVGAEETHPIFFKAEASIRALGLPLLPVTPTFPVLGPLGVLPLPSKWVVTIGEPVGQAGAEAGESGEEEMPARLAEELRARVRELVSRGLGRRSSVWG